MPIQLRNEALPTKQHQPLIVKKSKYIFCTHVHENKTQMQDKDKKASNQRLDRGISGSKVYLIEQ
jgi:hypothetical protein